MDLGFLLSISSLIGMHAHMHFLYTDDVLLFCPASPSAGDFDFELYGSLSSQNVSWEKSFIYFGGGISEARITDFFPLRV